MEYMLWKPSLTIHPFSTTHNKKRVVSILTYQDASYGTLTIYMYGLVNWSVTSEVLHWTGKRFEPLLFMLLNT